jgi:ParB family chromosome partitioning protein
MTLPPERRTLMRLRRSQLLPDPAQVRTTYGRDGLVRLADSMRAVGLQQALIVGEAVDTPDGPRHPIHDGHRRYFAMPFAGLEEVDCLVVTGPIDRLDLRLIQLSLGATNEQLSPYDLADGAREQMQSRNMTQEEVAAAIGVSPSKLSKALGIKEWLTELRADIESGAIPFTVAAALARLRDDVPARLDIAAKYKQGLLTRDAVEAEVARRLAARNGTPRREKPVRLYVGGVTVIVELFDGPKVEAALTLVGAALKRRERHNLPWSSLPQLVTS